MFASRLHAVPHECKVLYSTFSLAVGSNNIQSDGAKVWILQATFVAIGNLKQPHTYCFGLCSLTEADLYSNLPLLKPLAQDSNEHACHQYRLCF
jgi:hypothetical protein